MTGHEGEGRCARIGALTASRSWRSAERVSTLAAPDRARCSRSCTEQLQARLDRDRGAARRRARLRRRRSDSHERVAARLADRAVSDGVHHQAGDPLRAAEASRGRQSCRSTSRRCWRGTGGRRQRRSAAPVRPMLSLSDHAALMIILSDNTATNVVIDAVGMANVKARMKALGLGDILLRRKMMDARRVRRGDENVASPASLAQDGRAVLARGGAAAAKAATPGRGFSTRSGGQIRGAVPGRVRVASKTGTLDGVRAEAAVVELEGRPFALAVDDDVPAQRCATASARSARSRTRCSATSSGWRRAALWRGVK